MSIVALAVRQPWANLIASGKKTIETRRWRTVHRGPLLVCSSVQPRIAPAGCAVAIVNLIDCRPMTAADEPLACCPVYPGAWAWVLAEIRPIKPFRVRGQQRLFRVTLPASGHPEHLGACLEDLAQVQGAGARRAGR